LGEREYKELSGQLGELITEIGELEDLAVFAEDKPIFPDNRPRDFFNVGEKIIACNEAGKMIQGEVINQENYRYHDGIVEFIVNIPVEYGGLIYYCGSVRGDLVKFHEFQYLTQHKDFLEVWKKHTDMIHPNFISYIENYDPSMMIGDVCKKL